MKRITSSIALSSILLLSACAEGQQTADALARQSAKSVVAEVVATKFPFVPKAAVTPFTDCIIDNATSSEILTLASAAVLGVSDETVEITGQVLNRSETQTCVARASVGALTSL